MKYCGLELLHIEQLSFNNVNVANLSNVLLLYSIMYKNQNDENLPTVSGACPWALGSWKHGMKRTYTQSRQRIFRSV